MPFIQYKSFPFSIRTSDPIEFCANKNESTMSELRRHLEGTCFRGCYIIQIARILHTSAVRISTSGDGVIDVQFMAKVRVFARGDILVGVKIDEVSKLLLGSYLDSDGVHLATVSISAADISQVLSVGQLATIRVDSVMLKPTERHAKIHGGLLTCDSGDDQSYRVKGHLGSGSREELRPLVDLIQSELSARESAMVKRKGDFWLFELLLYAYRSKTVSSEEEKIGRWVGPQRLVQDDAVVDILDIATRVLGGEDVRVDGCWSRPKSLVRSSPLAVNTECEDAVCCSPAQAFAIMLGEMYQYLEAVRQMVEVYAVSIDAIRSYNTIWSMMRGRQEMV